MIQAPVVGFQWGIDQRYSLPNPRSNRGNSGTFPFLRQRHGKNQQRSFYLWGCPKKTQNDSNRPLKARSFITFHECPQIGNSPKAAAYFLLHNGLFHTPQHHQMPRHKTHLACDSTSRWLRNMVATWTRDKVSESWNVWMLSMGIQHDMKPKGTIQHPKNLLNTSIYTRIYCIYIII